MIYLIKLLIFGHVHTWETESRSPFTQTMDGRPVNRGTRYVLRCKCCGDVTKRDLI